jgi:hypothetical protein
VSSDRRDGPRYRVSDEEKERFHRDGYVHLRGVLSDDELAEISRRVRALPAREIAVPGKDLCDMSGDYGRAFEQYSIVNVMLPRRYYPAWQGNRYEQRAASIAEQLHGPGMVIDYDQLLAKRPFKDDAVFEWHQDQAYWPVFADSRTATVWLAIDDSTLANGCMRFVPGTHLAAAAPAPAAEGRPRRLAHAAHRRRSGPRRDPARADPARRRHRAQRARAPRLGRQLDRRLAARVRRRVPRGGDRGRGAAARLHALPQRREDGARQRRLRRRAREVSVVQRERWGTTSAGEPVELFTAETGELHARLASFGATLVSLEVPDKSGERANVVLGFDTLAEYDSAKNPYCGGIVGRCANRIAGARFTLDGHEHALAANEGRNHLHGGARGFDRGSGPRSRDRAAASRSTSRAPTATRATPDGSRSPRATPFRRREPASRCSACRCSRTRTRRRRAT